MSMKGQIQHCLVQDKKKSNFEIDPPKAEQLFNITKKLFSLNSVKNTYLMEIY